MCSIMICINTHLKRVCSPFLVLQFKILQFPIVFCMKTFVYIHPNNETAPKQMNHNNGDDISIDRNLVSQSDDRFDRGRMYSIFNNKSLLLTPTVQN